MRSALLATMLIVAASADAQEAAPSFQCRQHGASLNCITSSTQEIQSVHPILTDAIPRAIERTDQDNPSHLEAMHQLEARITALEAQIAEADRVTAATWKCFSRALIGGGADLGTTALALATRDDLKESNPLGFNVEARVALKFAQVGISGWGCYVLEKGGHKKAAGIASWASLLAQLGFAANNLILTLNN